MKLVVLAALVAGLGISTLFPCPVAHAQVASAGGSVISPAAAVGIPPYNTANTSPMYPTTDTWARVDYGTPNASLQVWYEFAVTWTNAQIAGSGGLALIDQSLTPPGPTTVYYDADGIWYVDENPVASYFPAVNWGTVTVSAQESFTFNGTAVYDPPQAESNTFPWHGN